MRACGGRTVAINSRDKQVAGRPLPPQLAACTALDSSVRSIVRPPVVLRRTCMLPRWDEVGVGGELARCCAMKGTYDVRTSSLHHIDARGDLHAGLVYYVLMCQYYRRLASM